MSLAAGRRSLSTVKTTAAPPGRAWRVDVLPARASCQRSFNFPSLRSSKNPPPLGELIIDTDAGERLWTGRLWPVHKRWARECAVMTAGRREQTGDGFVTHYPQARRVN